MRTLVPILFVVLTATACNVPLHYPMPIQSANPTLEKSRLGQMKVDFKPIIDAGWSLRVCRGEPGCENVQGSFADPATKTVYIKSAHQSLNAPSVFAHELAHTFMLELLTDAQRAEIFAAMNRELSWCRSRPCSLNWWYAKDLPAHFRPVEIIADHLGSQILREGLFYTPATGSSVWGQEGTEIDQELAELVYSLVFKQQ